MLGVFMTTPGQTVGVSVFIDYVGADLGLPRAQVLLLYSIGTLLGILPAPYIGRLVDRYGPRNAIGSSSSRSARPAPSWRGRMARGAWAWRSRCCAAPRSAA